MTQPLLFLSSLLLASSAVNLSNSTESREITVTLRFQTSDGDPGPAWRFAVETSQGLFREMTDDKGTAVFRVIVGDDETSVRLILDPTSVPNQYVGEERERAERMLAFMQKYYIPGFHAGYLSREIRLDPKCDDYSMDLVGLSSIAISARLVSDDLNVEMGGFVYARHATWRAMVQRDGTFEFGGVAKDAHNELFVCRGPVVAVIALSADQTASDLNLGAIQLPVYPADPFGLCRVKGTLLKNKEMFKDRRLIIGATLISDNGQRMFFYFTGEDGLLYYEYNKQREPFAIPVGTYYIAPESFSATKFQLGLLDAIRAKVDLNNTGIPMVVVEDGKLTELTFDLGAAAKAIQNVMDQMAQVDPSTTKEPP